MPSTPATYRSSRRRATARRRAPSAPPPDLGRIRDPPRGREPRRQPLDGHHRAAALAQRLARRRRLPRRPVPLRRRRPRRERRAPAPSRELPVGIGMRRATLALLIAACGASAPPETVITPRETDACHAARLEILAAIAQSRERPCSADAECTTVMSPNHPDRELAEVAHGEDARALEARSVAHLETCGAWALHE